MMKIKNKIQLTKIIKEQKKQKKLPKPYALGSIVYFNNWYEVLVSKSVAKTEEDLDFDYEPELVNALPDIRYETVSFLSLDKAKKGNDNDVDAQGYIMHSQIKKVLGKSKLKLSEYN